MKRNYFTSFVGGILLSLATVSSAADKLVESDYYTRETIPMPDGEVLEVGSIALLPDKKVAVATRHGEIWVCKGAYGNDLSKVSWKLFFQGVHEPFGMYWKDGWLYVADRGEFARIKDSDGDGEGDTYELISRLWGINGDYHEYTFGSTPDKDGNTWLVLCLTGSVNAKSPWRGWAIRVSPDGKALPVCSGIRSPGGIGVDVNGQAFYSDNQGFWNGTSCIKPLIEGKFTGNPAGNVFYKDAPHMGKRPLDPRSGSRIMVERERIPEYVPPAVQIPHGKMGQSTSGIIYDRSKGKFGPFAGQMLVGDQTHSQVQRVYLEKVNGVYQGAVWKLVGGFDCGIVPMRMSDEGVLFTGGTNRGWASRGGKSYSFERVKWSGKTPFEMKTMEVTEKGFKLSFTKPLDRTVAADVKNYPIKAWTYIYQHSYGSPEVDQFQPSVIKATVSADGLCVDLEVNGRVQGHVHHLDASALRSEDGLPLLHADVYYTLNEVPGNPEKQQLKDYKELLPQSLRDKLYP